jgi:hypothetical protein
MKLQALHTVLSRKSAFLSVLSSQRCASNDRRSSIVGLRNLRMPAMRVGLAALCAGVALTSPARAQESRPPAPGLVLVKTADTRAVSGVGSIFSYELNAINATARAIDVTLLDVLPPAVNFEGQAEISASGVITAAANQPGLSADIEAFAWRGALGPGAKLSVRIPVKLIACPAEPQNWPLGIDRAVRNTATLESNGRVQVASHAFLPPGCDAVPTPRPLPTIPAPILPPTLTAVADGKVAQFARLHPDYGRPERGWVTSWYVFYANVGGQALRDATLIDTPSANQTLLGSRSAPLITPTVENGEYTYALGALQPGQWGALMLRTGVSFTTPAGTMLSNRAAIAGAGDANALNNTAAATVTIPHLPPLITSPRSGATCTGTQMLQGKAQVGAEVVIAVDDVEVGKATADADGRWQFELKLDDGMHRVEARTRAVNGESRRSPHVVLKVDSTLNWDPISTTFVDASGDARRPRHWMGWMDRSGWYVGLTPNMTYTFNVKSCCEGPATITATIPGTGDIALNDPDGDGVHSATFRTGSARALASAPLVLCVTGDGETQCVRARVVPTPAEINARRVLRVVIRDGVAEPRNVTVMRGDVVEIVNMDDVARAFSPRRDQLAFANASAAAPAGAEQDAFALEAGESYSYEVTDARTLTFYDTASGVESLTVSAAALTYLPLATR